MAEINNAQAIDQESTPRPRRAVWRNVALGGVGLVAAGLTVAGAWLMTREDNWEDFSRLREFTSAEHQEDRCEVEGAVDAQEKMRQHFEGQGGPTDAEVELFSASVGLEQDEIRELLTTELYEFSYDCVDDNGIASTQEATIGLAAGAVGVGLGAGALAGAALARRNNQ